jgi:hypothetical protein
MRQDLLLLTSDDLITLSNRGIVKRAQQEMQSLELQAEFQEDAAGNVVVLWSDKICCKLPANMTITQGQCSCPATSLCRHIVRSVLAYQAKDLNIDQSKSAAIALRPAKHRFEATSEPCLALDQTCPQVVPKVVEWNPADISDELLQAQYSKSQLAKLRTQYSAGLVIGVNCGAKPTAHFHTLSLNLRFLVPNDPRYTHCDCSEAAPCSHVPLAVWAFRELGDRNHGLISTAFEVIPTALLDDIETHLLELAECGIANMERTLPDRLNRLEQRCRAGNLVWLAEILVDLLQTYHLYQQHDGSFAPDRVVALLAELWMRSDAIRHRDFSGHQIPQLLIGGSQLNKTSSLGASRLVGLGCGVTVQTKGVTLTTYLQDSDSGTLMAMPKYFANGDNQPVGFQQLAQSAISKGLSLASIGAGQLLTKGGKRTPSYEFVPGRSAMSLHPQSFRWEQLRSPLLVDSFADLQATLIDLPPRSLRPRRVTESLQVLPINQVEQVSFDPITQNVCATLLDATGDRALLIHPYTSRSAAGAEALLNKLSSEPQNLRFLSAQVSLGASGLVLAPLSLVFESGDQRSLLQPWIAPATNVAPASRLANTPQLSPRSPIADYLQQLSIALADLWLVGLNKADEMHCRQWQELLEQGKLIDFQRLLRPLELLSGALNQKSHALTWDLRPASQALSTLTVLSELSHQALAEQIR